MDDFVEKIEADDVNGNVTFEIQIECGFCATRYEDSVNDMQDADAMEAEFAKALTEAGWGMLASNEFMAIGFACPDCIKQEKHWRVDNE